MYSVAGPVAAGRFVAQMSLVAGRCVRCDRESAIGNAGPGSGAVGPGRPDSSRSTKRRTWSGPSAAVQNIPGGSASSLAPSDFFQVVQHRVL